MVEDAGWGWRRVVASPFPEEIVELPAVRQLIEAGITTITVGGGDIPVVRNDQGNLEGVPAVIDKDYASATLAQSIDADLLLISTAVEHVYLNFGRPGQDPIDEVTVAEAKQYIEECYFAAGSMLPKIKAIICFLEEGGREALITNPEKTPQALVGETAPVLSPRLGDGSRSGVLWSPEPCRRPARTEGLRVYPPSPGVQAPCLEH